MTAAAIALLIWITGSIIFSLRVPIRFGESQARLRDVGTGWRVIISLLWPLYCVALAIMRLRS